jgi:hypothetical protein
LRRHGELAFELHYWGPMMMDKRLLGLASVAALGLGACGLGEADNTHDNTALNKELCHTDLAITGNMVPGAKPPDYDPNLGDTNCWPVGVWTFSAAAKAANDDGSAQCGQVSLLPEYKFQVVRDFANDGAESYAFLTDPKAKIRIKVSSGGGGLCEGVIEMYSADGKTLHNLHPALQAPTVVGGNQALLGHGEYTQYEVDQWIP